MTIVLLVLIQTYKLITNSPNRTEKKTGPAHKNLELWTFLQYSPQSFHLASLTKIYKGIHSFAFTNTFWNWMLKLKYPFNWKYILFYILDIFYRYPMKCYNFGIVYENVTLYHYCWFYVQKLNSTYRKKMHQRAIARITSLSESSSVSCFLHNY